MELTKASNIDFCGISKLINEANYIQICGHTSPDGDCISSQLALKRALSKLNKQVDVLLALNEKPPYLFDYLCGFDDLKFASRVNKRADLFIMVDAPNDNRIGFQAAKLKDKACISLTIDHHFEEKRWSDWTLVDPSSASTSTLVWELLAYMNLNDDSDIATCCLTGLKTDTGNFLFQNANLRSFKRASEMIEAGADNSLISEKVFMRKSLTSVKIEQIAVSNMEILENGRVAITTISKHEMQHSGASKDDTENVVNILRAIDGTEVVAFLREEQDYVKVSFRSLGDFDCRELACIYGGGGHAGAAGARIDNNLEIAKNMVVDQLSNLFG